MSRRRWPWVHLLQPRSHQTPQFSPTPTLLGAVAQPQLQPARCRPQVFPPAHLMPGTTPVVIVPTATPGRPATYTIHTGEFPYCLARRFDVNPDDLLSMNGLVRGQILQPGLTLNIPQTGSFPGSRALHTHPAQYTVNVDDSFYSIACYFGDVDPILHRRRQWSIIDLSADDRADPEHPLNKNHSYHSPRRSTSPGCYFGEQVCRLNS